MQIFFSLLKERKHSSFVGYTKKHRKGISTSRFQPYKWFELQIQSWFMIGTDFIKGFHVVFVMNCFYEISVWIKSNSDFFFVTNISIYIKTILMFQRTVFIKNRSMRSISNEAFNQSSKSSFQIYSLLYKFYSLLHWKRK